MGSSFKKNPFELAKCIDSREVTVNKKNLSWTCLDLNYFKKEKKKLLLEGVERIQERVDFKRSKTSCASANKLENPKVNLSRTQNFSMGAWGMEEQLRLKYWEISYFFWVIWRGANIIFINFNIKPRGIRYYIAKHQNDCQLQICTLFT